MKQIPVGVIGATGYAGAELVRLLLSHPNVTLAALSSVSFEGKALCDDDHRKLRHSCYKSAPP